MSMKKISLCLWWGAAKGFSHIWVFRRLEELNYEIEEVSWTSMWAIIASCIAVWMTSNEMFDLCDKISYRKLTDIDLSTWIIAWDAVKEFLWNVFWSMKIENCKIKLKIIATDIESWKTVVFEKWKIVDAVRASISIPWIFTPYKIDWKTFVDWGLLCNLPVDCLRWDNLIISSTCSASKFELWKKKKVLWVDFNEWFFSSNFRMIQRTMELMIWVNEEKSITKIPEWKDYILIRPSYEDNSMSDFKAYKEISEIWYIEASKFLK